MHTNNATKLHYWCAMLLINLIHMMIRRTTNSFRLSRNTLQRWLMLSLVGSCWLSAVAFAQVEDTRKTIRMPELVITSTPFKDRSELNMTQPTSILQGDNLRRKRETSLGDTLINEVGVTSSSFGPGAGRPIIRALDGPRIQVLENGIGSLDVSSLSPDHPVAIETLNASQIEILRGPATLLYGGGATGGVVNTVNRNIPNQLHKALTGSFEVRGNTATEERAGSVNLSRSFGSMSWSVSGFRRNTGDYNIPGQANISGISPEADGGSSAHSINNRTHELKNSAAMSQGGSVGGSYVGERGFLGGSISLMNSKFGIPSLEAPTIDMTQARYNLAGALDNPIKGFEKLKVRTGYNDYKHDERERTGELGTRFKNRELETRVELLHTPINELKGAVGVHFQDRTFSALGEESIVPITHARSTGVFLLEERSWEKLRVEMGGRYEHATRNPQYNVSPARSFDLFSGSIGGFWNVIQDYNVGLTATHGQRAPAIEELYVNGAHHATATFQTGDATLRKEASNNIDLSINKATGPIRWKINGFYNYFNDYIFLRNSDRDRNGIADRVDEEGILDPAGEFLVQDMTQRNATFYGAEAEANLTLKPETLELRLFTDYVRGKLNNGGNIPRVTPQRFGMELNYVKGPWSGNLTTIYVLRQNKRAELETSTADYVLLNLEASYRIKQTKADGIRFFIQGRNLLNEEIRYHTSFLKNFVLQPGVALVAGIRGDF